MSDPTHTTRLRSRAPKGLLAVASWTALWLLGSALGVPDAQALQVKRVLTNSCTVPNGTETVSVDLSTDANCNGTTGETNDNLLGGVDLVMNKSFVIATQRMSENFNTRTDFIVMVDDPKTVVITRNTGSTAATFEYMVVEFASGVNVQHGMTTFSETQAASTKNIILPTPLLDLSRAFALVTWRSYRHNTQDQHDDKNLFSAELTALTTLQVKRDNQQNQYNNDVAYQVIEFDRGETVSDVNVVKGVVDLDNSGTADSGETSDDGITLVVPVSPAVNDAKSILFFTRRAVSGVGGEENQYQVDGALATGGASITFFRNTSGADANDQLTIVYYLLEFKNNVFGQKGRTPASGAGSLAAGTGSTTATLTAVVPARTFVATFVSGGTNDDSGDTAELDDTKVTTQLTNSTTLTLTRATTTTGARVSYYAMQLPPVRLKSPNGGENWTVWKTGDPFKRIEWEYSDEAAGHTVELRVAVNDGTAEPTVITCEGNPAPILASDGYCDWKIPPALGTTNLLDNRLKIEIKDTTAGLAPYDTDRSNANFEIKGQLSITAPVGGETWKVGETTRTITWDNRGNFNGASITGTVYYSTAGSGGPWTAIPGGSGTCGGGAVALGTDAGSGGSNSCTWNPIPDAITANAFVKIEANYTATYDSSPTSLTVSPAAFNIKGQLTLTAHNGGSPNWPTQTNQAITWTKNGTMGAYTILYSLNSGGQYTGTVASALSEATYCTGGSCSYTWNVANAAISDFVRLKVQSDQAAALQVADESDADFKIKPSLKVTSPNLGSEVWKVADVCPGANCRTIQWDVNGSIVTVRLEYSTNGFSNETQTNSIVASTTADTNPTGDNMGAYPWPSVPDAIGDNLKIRICDTAASSPPLATDICDVSDNAFKIRGKIAVTAPTGSEVNTNALRVNTSAMPSTFLITWSRDGSFGNVDVHYSTNDGSSYPDPANAIVSNYSTGNNVTWTIPDAITTLAKIRVRSTTYPTDTFGESPTFHIKGAIDVTFPDGGGAPLPAGVNQTITWNKAGTLGNVKIEYATDGVTFTNTVIAATPADTDPPTGANNGQYGPWAPTVVDNRYKVRISLVGDETNVSNTSNTAFEVKGSITNVTPNGNADPALTDYWMVGETNRNIGWTSTPADQGNVDILYSLDAGNSFPDPSQLIVTVASTASPYTWPSIPVAAIGESVRFRIQRDLDPSVKDDTDNNIRIYNLTIDAPTAGEILRIGGNKLIQWTKSGAFTVPSANLKVIVSTDGTSFPDPANLIATTTGSSYNWTTIPISFRSNTVKIKVQWQGSTNVEKISGLVYIKPSVNLTAPDGGGPYGAGTDLAITFTHTGDGADTWRLIYSTNGGDAGGGTYPNPANVITTLTCATPPCTYNWTMPSTLLSNNVRVKAELVGDEANVKDESVNAFEVKGSITNIAPNSTQYWMVGELKNISWTSNPTDQGNVRIVYSLDGTAYPESAPDQKVTPVDVNSSTSPYPWTVSAGAIGETIYFRIYRVLDPTVKIENTTPIKVYNLSVNALPAILRIGSTQLIQWTKTGSFTSPSADFKVYISTDGTSFPPGNEITGPPLPTGSSFNWTNIPASFRSNTVKVRVEWQGSTNVKADSGLIAIKPDVNLTGPDGGGPYGAGTGLGITFTHTGSGTDNWKLLYSLNGGDAGGGTYPLAQEIATVTSTGVTPLNSNTITCTSTVSPVACTWTIPSTSAMLSNNVRVKVQLVGDETNVKDESISAFEVKGSLTGISPNTTQYWMVGETRSISWTSSPADQGNVKIVWSFDGTNFPEPGQLQATVNSTATPYSFTVGAAHKGENVTWRVYRDLDPSVKVTAAAPVKIYNLLLDQPVASEILRVGTAKTIQWTKDAGAFTSPSAEFAVLMSKDGGAYTEITNPAARPTGTSFSYTPVSADRSANVRFKVEWQGATNVNVVSPQVSIRPNVTLTSPTSGTFSIDDPMAITFSHTGITGPSGDTWRILYSTDGGQNYPNPANVIHTTAIGPASPYTYNWTVPEAAGIVGNQFRLKVEMVGDETNVKSESANMTIRGKLTVTAPTSTSTVWKVGDTTRAITWTSKGLTNVAIAYTKNNGTDGYVNTIVSSTAASTGSYTWNPAGPPAGIPLSATSNAFKIRVKAADAADSTTEAFSALFTVVPKLTLTYPVGGETMIVYALSSAATRTITWTRSGDSRTTDDDYVEVYYTKDTTGDTDSDGIPDPPEATWTAIATGASAPLSSAGQYTWASVANDVTTSARIVLRLKTDSKTKDIKSAFFRIRADVVVDQPTAAALEIGANTDYAVKWTPTGTFPGGTTVALEWTTDDFATIINAVTGPAAESAATLAVGADGVQQSFTWRLPTSLTTTGKVRVRVNGDTISAKSLNTFTIKGSLTSIVPNTTQYWMVGETKSIDWASVPADQGDVKIVWSFDGVNFPESAPNQVLAQVNSTLHPYSFTVGAVHKGENVTWRVYRVLDANVKVTSATPVKIYNLLLDQPVASEILRIGTAKLIQWTKDAGAFTSPSAEFAVYKSVDGGAYAEITNPASRPTGTSFSYTPLDADRSNNVKFRVEWQGATNVKVDSAQVSVKPKVDLTSPDSGTYSVDDSIPITFSHTGRTGPSGDTWEIYYSTNGGDAGGGTYPLANKIHTTAIGPASPYTFNWTVPDTAGIVGSNVRFKVEMVGDATNVKDESVGTITLRGKLVVTAPVSTSTVWKVGGSGTVTWTSKQLTNVRIDYTKNNGTDGYANTITASTAASAGTYTWNPTGPPAGIPTTATSDQFKVRIKAIDAADSATEQFSALFSVVPKLTLTYPVGGETLVVYAVSSAATRTITWTRSGDSRTVDDDSVEVYYTKDTTADTNGDGIPDPPEVSWIGIATGASAPLSSAGQYTWASVANDVSTTARIVLRLKNDSKTKDIKTSFSRIRADVKLDTPGEATNQAYGAATNYAVKWTPTGTFPGGTTVALEWSTDNFGAVINPVTGPAGESAATLAVGADGIQQSFTWKVPNNPSTTVKIRVKVNGDTIESKSANNFAIVGQVFVDVPNGPATAWVPGDAESIQWHQLGGVSTINIYFSRNNGADNYPVTVATGVAAGPETGSSLPWPGGVPNEATADTYRIKIVDANNANVFDVSDAGFIIKARISGVSPGGSSPEYVGDPLTVAWTETGQPGPVTIQLSRNAFADETQNVTLTTAYTHGALVQYVVPGGVPNELSETVKYRVKSEQANSALVASEMSAASHPLRGKITVNAMPTLTLGDTASVSWSRSGSIGNVKVEYFDGTSWATLTTTAAEAGPYSFSMTTPTINETATNLAQVRVSDADRAEVVSTSAAFLVKPLISVTSPTNNDARTYNVAQNITWNKKGGNVLNVKIEYFNGSVWADLFGGTTSNDTMESWTAPDNVSNLFNKQIRISTLPGTDPWVVTVTQNGNFKIVGTVTVTSPISTDKWVAGSTNNVKWSKTGTNLTAIRLDYTTDNWNSSGTIVASYDATLGATGYPWPIPLTAVTNTAIIKISDANDASVSDLSDTFKIIPGFTVQRPSSAERVKVGQQFQIQWDRQGTGTPNTVNLYYSTNNGGAWTSIASAQTNSGTYDWNVPDLTGLPLASSLVKVEWTGDAGALDESALFKLVAGFTMVSPNSTADKWDVGTVNKPVTWTCTSANVPKAKLEYSTNGGTSYDFVIASEADNSGLSGATRTYLWPSVDNAITDQFRVRVSQPFVSGVQAADTDFASGAGDISDANAKIKMYTRVLTPNATGIELIKGSSYNITWTTTGTGPTTTNVKLFYSKDDFATPGIAIMDGALDYTGNDGLFAWTVPDDITTTATVKVRAQSWTDLDAKDESDNFFKIEGDYTISSPIINDPFKIYDAVQNPVTHPITWTTIGGLGGTMGTVNLIAYTTDPIDPYFRDGGGVVHTLSNPLTIVSGLANTPNGATTYNWQVPDKATTTAVIRVINPADTTVFKDSPTFKIQASVTLTAPNSLSLTLVVGDPYTIAWNKTGSSLARVKITLSKNGLAGPFNPILETFETANDGIVSNTGSFAWTVPDQLSANCLIRIEDPNDSAVVSTTAVANAFRIRGGLTFVTPTTTTPQTRWVTNESRIVSWNTTGSITAVNLIYTKNNFGATTPVVSNYGNAVGLNTYPWTIPNDQSTTVKLRLFDANDTAVYSDSAQFTIDLYNITFEIRDLLTNNHISGLAVNGTSNTGGYTWVASVSSPITKGLQAGGWNLTFTKSEYADIGASFVSDADKTIVLYGETKVVHVWESIAEIAYNPGTDVATLSATLSRDGIIVTGATSCTINLYDGATLVKTFTKAGVPDTAQGFYSFTWAAPTGLVSGKVYNVVTTIVNATGGNINTPSTFSITEVKKLQDVQDTVNAKLDTSLSQVRTDMKNIIQDRLGFTDADVAGGKTMKSELAAQTAAIGVALTSLESAADDVEGAAGKVELRSEDLQATNLKFSGRLAMPRTVLINDKDVKINYQAIPGLVPLLTITTVDQTAKEVVVVKNFPMSQSKDRADVYEYTIDKITSPPYLPGKFATVMVEAEVFKYKLQTKTAEKNLEVGSFIVESTTLSTLEGLVAGQSGVKDTVVDVLSLMRALQASLGTGGSGNMAGLLQAMSAKIDALPREIARAMATEGSTVQMRNTVNEIAQQIRILAGNDLGYDFSKLVGKALDESASLNDIRKKADTVQGTTEVMQVLMEQKLGGIDAPVVHVIYQ